jgi:hypothetical protein
LSGINAGAHRQKNLAHPIAIDILSETSLPLAQGMHLKRYCRQIAADQAAFVVRP